MELIVVSGLSGGGKSTVLRALEDLGMYCVDNLPVPLVPSLVELVEKTNPERTIAVGLDARETEYLSGWGDAHDTLAQAGHKVSVIFVEASQSVLVGRFSSTRRLHPMGHLPDAIERERELLAPIRERADVVFDSSGINARQLRQLVRDRFSGGDALRVTLVSFGFRNGLPPQADMVLDARFLTNPHEDKELRPLSGLHEPVAKFVLDQPDAQELLGRAEDLVRFMVDRVAAEGRSYLTLAIGCTGGQHRSVALVEALKRRLEASEGGGRPQRLLVRHRDVGGTA